MERGPEGGSAGWRNRETRSESSPPNPERHLNDTERDHNATEQQPEDLLLELLKELVSMQHALGQGRTLALRIIGPRLTALDVDMGSALKVVKAIKVYTDRP